MTDNDFLTIIFSYIPTVLAIIIAIALFILAVKNKSKLDTGIFIGVAVFLLGRAINAFYFKQIEVIASDGRSVNVGSFGTLYGYYITIIGLGIVAICLLIKAIKK